jgi:hypothetical protein
MPGFITRNTTWKSAPGRESNLRHTLGDRRISRRSRQGHPLVDSARGSIESRQESVAYRLDLAATEPPQVRSHDLVVLAADLGPRPVRHRRALGGRVNDIGVGVEASNTHWFVELTGHTQMHAVGLRLNDVGQNCRRSVRRTREHSPRGGIRSEESMVPAPRTTPPRHTPLSPARGGLTPIPRLCEAPPCPPRGGRRTSGTGARRRRTSS